MGRFRAVNVEAELRSQDYATVGLRDAIANALNNENLAKLGSQGDEPNEPFDVLRAPPDADPQKLHPYFKELAERPGLPSARAVVKEIGPWLAPSDPNLVQEFQFNQFDQRLWELYLWAAFRELWFRRQATRKSRFHLQHAWHRLHGRGDDCGLLTNGTSRDAPESENS